jgi:LysR family transcriptional regulator, nitrogen assimilation regulatory protein
VSNIKRGLKPFAPVRLKECGPLKIILPSRANVRRRNIEIYFETHGIEVESIIEMDAMIGTLQFVLRSDWVAILSGLICVADIERRTGRVISPIDDPPLIAEFVVISPARRMLSPQAQLFLEAFEAEIARIQSVWAKTIPPVVYPSVPRRATRR